jgi:hypothetical protein
VQRFKARLLDLPDDLRYGSRTRRGVLTVIAAAVLAIGGARLLSAGSGGVAGGLLGVVLGITLAVVLIAVAARQWDRRTAPAVPSFARRSPGSAAQSQVRLDPNALVWSDRGGFLWTRRWWFTGTCCPPIRTHQHVTSPVGPDDEPAYITSYGPRRWWSWREDFYWSTGQFAASDVRALLLERERRERRRLEHAHTMMRVEDGLAVEERVGARQRQPLSEDVKRFVFRRDEGICQTCGSRELLQFDHILPVAMGGSDEPENLQLLCADCNRAKGGTL